MLVLCLRCHSPLDGNSSNLIPLRSPSWANYNGTTHISFEPLPTELSCSIFSSQIRWEESIHLETAMKSSDLTNIVQVAIKSSHHVTWQISDRWRRNWDNQSTYKFCDVHSTKSSIKLTKCKSSQLKSSNISQCYVASTLLKRVRESEKVRTKAGDQK